MSLVGEEERQTEAGLIPGTVVSGRFRVERKLGEGGMGAVYAAFNITTNRPVALKVMHPEYAAKKDVVRRFLREAKAATAITHPNVIEVLDVVDGEHGEPVMVMELLSGEALDALLERRGALSLGEVARIMTPVVSAVGAAHARGIIHRDLKPENIFLTKLGDGTTKPKVLDFGIAKILDPTQINEGMTKSGATRTGSMLGTPYYMSIEQACGEKDIDHRSDIWSIGVILYTMLAGKRPYEGENYGQILKALMTDTPPSIGSLVSDLPADVAEIVDRCIARPRDKRPSDLREVYAVLSRYCDAVSLPGPPSASQQVIPHGAGNSATLAAASVYTSNIPMTGITTKKSRRGVWMIAVPVVLVVVAGSAVLVARGRSSSASMQPVAEPTQPTVPSAAVAAAPDAAASSTSGVTVEPLGSGSASASATKPPPVGATGKGKPKDTGGKPPVETTSKPPPPSTGGGIIEKSPY
ncbi:MAG: serine/threonine protein kinase [Deltaproteobacteria bacterium]|nr:serine/threonine protein kinase [Deltaproteobacteria bacterium]